MNPNHDRPNLTYEFLGSNQGVALDKRADAGSLRTGPCSPAASRGGAEAAKEIPRRDARQSRGHRLGRHQTRTAALHVERVGYPTQKPLALLERIISASSNPGDVVLDPFCGCATALIAAEKLERQWIGIDLSPVARTLVQRRMANELGFDSLGVIYRDDIPRRTDIDRPPPYRTQKQTLFGIQEGICAGCKISFPSGTSQSTT